MFNISQSTNPFIRRRIYHSYISIGNAFDGKGFSAAVECSNTLHRNGLLLICTWSYLSCVVVRQTIVFDSHSDNISGNNRWLYNTAGHVQDY